MVGRVGSWDWVAGSWSSFDLVVRMRCWVWNSSEQGVGKMCWVGGSKEAVV